MKRVIKSNGFTIVELVITVLVIGVLATVAIVGYGAWRTKLASDVVRSDLSQVASAMKSAQSFGSTGYPEILPTTVQASANVQLTGAGRPGGKTFCVQGTFTGQTSIQYYVSNKQLTPIIGTCATSTTVLAGSSTGGYINGTGAAAQFTRIEGIGIGQNGLIYAADGSYARRITANGVVTSYDGTGADGFTAGAVGPGWFNGARGAAVDSAGNVYIVSINDNSLYKIATNGVRTNIAPGVIHGTDVILGADNNFYALVGDNFSGALDVITMAGASTRLVGNATNASIDGQGTAGSLYDPRGLTRASDGTIYICENGGGLVRKVTPSYYVSTYAGPSSSYAGGATSPIAGWCDGVAVDTADVLYVASGGKVQTIDQDGTVTDFATVSTVVTSLAFDNDGNLLVATGTRLYKVTVP